MLGGNFLSLFERHQFFNKSLGFPRNNVSMKIKMSMMEIPCGLSIPVAYYLSFPYCNMPSYGDRNWTWFMGPCMYPIYSPKGFFWIIDVSVVTCVYVGRINRWQSALGIRLTYSLRRDFCGPWLRYSKYSGRVVTFRPDCNVKYRNDVTHSVLSLVQLFNECVRPDGATRMDNSIKKICGLRVSSLRISINPTAY